MMDMTVLERQQARFKWLEHHQQQISENNSNYVNQNYIETCDPVPRFQGLMDLQMLDRGDVAGWNMENKPESYLGTCELMRYGGLVMVGGDGAELVQVQGDSTDVGHCLSRSSSCRVGAVEVGKMEEDEVEDAAGEVAGGLSLMQAIRPEYGGDSLHKRKAEVVEAEEQSKEKRIKGEIEVDSSTQEKSSTLVSPESSKDNQKSSGTQKQDYIHVRARRGQATDSHSLAERARREKISKKMKYLQDLVPGCNKITGRAGMLDEIINYVQSLQRQVEFLSMKLAALNPRQEPSIDNLILKEFPAYVNLSTPIANLNHHLNNGMQEQATSSEPEPPINPPPHEILPEIAPSLPMFIPELCPDSSSCFSQVQSFWDSDPQSHHNFGFH